MTDTIWWVAVVSALIASDAVLVWLGFAWHRRQGKAKPASGAQVPPERLRAEFATLRTAIEGLDACLATVDRAIRKSSADLTARDAPTGAGVTPAPRDGAVERGYAIAERLARKGASVSELVSDCGLSRGEAELIRNLHAPRARGGRQMA